MVTDDRALAATVLPRTDTTLGEVLRGHHPGRRSEQEITVYSPLGLPLQDYVVAWHAYRQALRRPESARCWTSSSEALRCDQRGAARTVPGGVSYS